MALDPSRRASLMPDWLEQRSRLTPHKLAIMSRGKSLSFVDLDTLVAATSERLSELGVVPKTHVAVLLPNNLLNVVVIHALIRLRAVLVPLNPRLTYAEINCRREKSKSTFLIVDSDSSSQPSSTSSGLPNPIAPRSVEVIRSDSLDLSHGPVTRHRTPEPRSTTERLDLDYLHSIIFTSGTTGQPKGVMLSYGNHWWNAMGSVLNLGLRDDDRWLLCLPFFHVGGLSILFRSVICGIPVVLHESFDAAQVNQSIDADRVTLISLVPTNLQRLLDSRSSRPFPASLRCVLLGGAQAPLTLLERCAGQSVPVCQTYGLTETASQLATLSPEDALTKIGSSGKPLFPAELRVENEGLAVEAGHIGEIVVRGPTVTAGYFDDAEATGQAIGNGWLHTRDMGYLDSDGYLYVVDREDDLIISGGENVYPAEIERVLAAHASIQDVAVFALPDPDWGRSIHAAVVLQPNTSETARDLQTFCRQKLAAYKIPKTIRFVESLPRNASGKILRQLLSHDFMTPIVS